MSLADTLRRQRESWIDAGGFRFQVRRPRDLDLVRWREDGGNAGVALHSVVGWEGVTQGDVIGGAQDDTPAEFSAELAQEWLGDHLDLLLPIWDEVQRLIVARQEARETAAKN
jgi:hypothetical protein